MSQLLTARPSTYQAYLEVLNPRFLFTLGRNSKEINFIFFYNFIETFYSDYTQIKCRDRGGFWHAVPHSTFFLVFQIKEKKKVMLPL